MTTTSAGAMPALVTLDEWDSDWSRRDETYELVDGIPEMAPSEVFRNRRTAARLMVLLDAALGHRAHVICDFDVLLFDVPTTVRRPDVLVLAKDLGLATRARTEDVLLVAEVVSPSSAVTDWRDKRDEYAKAGIPLYLVIDHRNDDLRLALFANPVDGSYPLPVGDDTDNVSFTLLDAQITVRARDLAG